MLTIHVHRGKTALLSELPTKSIALDGYVQGPEIDTLHHRHSFDHHKGCVRHATSATCVQVLDALCVGFDPSGYQVYVNDVDADTALSVFLIRFPQTARDPMVRRLVELMGKLDALGPAYTFLAAESAEVDRFLSQAMRPELEARRTGAYATINLVELLEECIERIAHFFAGTLAVEPEGEPAPMHVLFQEADLAMAEGGHDLIPRLYAQGYSKIILTAALPSGTRIYTVAKRSEFISFDVVGLLAALNAIEPGWGGGSTVGGAPRHVDGRRSSLLPVEVWATALNFL